MTTASKGAYFKPTNKIKRISDKETILTWLKHFKRESFIYPDLAKMLKLNANNVQKRCSDLHKEGKVKIVGELSGFSRYQFGESPIRLTKTEAFEKAISELCPMYLEDVKSRVKELT